MSHKWDNSSAVWLRILFNENWMINEVLNTVIEPKRKRTAQLDNGVGNTLVLARSEGHLLLNLSECAGDTNVQLFFPS